MKRKFLSLVLALVMVLGTVSAVFAETTPLTTNDAKVQWLVDNEVVVGRTVNKDDTNPDLALDKTITRAEVSKLLVYTLGQQKLADVLKGAIRVFPDVDLDHWANGYVSVLATNRTEVASGRDVVIGYEDGTFRPSNDVTYAELATMLVRIVKKDLTKKMEDEAIWATSYIRWAEELGILEGITLVNSDAPAVRKDAFVMIYNAMHKLDLIGKNKVDWGIKIGVVSKLQAGKMEINQDKEQVYNFTYNTVVTNGTNWNEVNVNTVVPGSLVRFIADENGNISHLLVVSVPEFGTEEDCQLEPSNEYSGWHRTDESRIFDLGQKVAGAKGGNVVLTSDYRPGANLKVYSNYCVDKQSAPVEIAMRGDTRVFVADVKNNALKEMKSLGDALRVYNANKNTFKGFVIYDQFKNYAGVMENEATVVVLTEVDKYYGEQDVLRVRYTPNSLYNVEFENTKGEAVIKNLFDYKFLAASWNLFTKDVVGLRLPTGVDATNFKNLIISYREDNVYTVRGISARYIDLEDYKGNVSRVGMPLGTKVFLERQLEVGARVQIARDATEDNVKVISVVNELNPRGIIGFKSYDSRVEKGFLKKLEPAKDSGYSVVTIEEEVTNHLGVTVRVYKNTYMVPNSVVAQLDLTNNIGKEFSYRVKAGLYHDSGLQVAVDWVNVEEAEKAEADKAAAAALDAKAEDLPSDDVTVDNFSDRYDKAKALSDEYKDLSTEAQALVKTETKDAINAEIDKVNTFNTDHSLGKTAIVKL